MSTVQEKLAQLGESMAVHRIEAKLGCRVVERRDEAGGVSYQVQFLDADGKARAVQPTAEWAWKFQRLLFDLANELTTSLADLAAGFESVRARAEILQAKVDAIPANESAAFAKGYEDGQVDGVIAGRSEALSRLSGVRTIISDQLAEEFRRSFPRKAAVDFMKGLLRNLDQVEVDFATASSAPRTGEVVDTGDAVTAPQA